jgi:hypothetical protein
LFFYPGLIMLLLGFSTMVWLLPGQRSAGAIVFDVNTLEFAAASVVCGFQAIVFYVLAKTYAIRTGLLPADSLVQQLGNKLPLEVGLLTGIASIAMGLGLATYAIGVWGAHSFGTLNPEQSLRVVIPSATLLMLGLQIIFSICLLSILQLETRTAGARTRETDRRRRPDARDGVDLQAADGAAK